MLTAAALPPCWPSSMTARRFTKATSCSSRSMAPRVFQLPSLARSPMPVPISATILNVSKTDANANAINAILLAMDDGTSPHKSLVQIQTPNGTKGFTGFITGTATDQGTYQQFPFAGVAQWGSLSNETI